MFGMTFFSNFGTNIFHIFLKGMTHKIMEFEFIQNVLEKTFFIYHTLEENIENSCFKIGKKLHTKHHQIVF